MVTYLSIRTAPVTRSISTPQKSKMKPWQSDELVSSPSPGASSCGGVQNTVSRSACAPSGTTPGDQWLAAARRPNGMALSGLPLAPILPSANSI